MHTGPGANEQGGEQQEQRACMCRMLLHGVCVCGGVLEMRCPLRGQVAVVQFASEARIELPLQATETAAFQACVAEMVRPLPACAAWVEPWTLWRGGVGATCNSPV